jgi:hypothetical protein
VKDGFFSKENLKGLKDKGVFNINKSPIIQNNIEDT